MSIKTLVINPGSTSTKVGVFEDETLLFEETLRHPTEEIAKYASVIDQKDFRKEIILDFLKEKNCDPKTLNVIVGRGGLLKPIPGGTCPQRPVRHTRVIILPPSPKGCWDASSSWRKHSRQPCRCADRSYRAPSAPS